MSFILATDLDGTFLSPEAHRAKPLYDYWRSGAGAALVFVSGRSLETIRPIIEDPLIPKPDYVIADVGASVADGRTLEPLQPLQAEIDQCWPGVYSLLEAVPELDEFERQPVPQERRMSFYASPSQITPELLGKLRALKLSVVYSHGRYLDILPSGVNKGTSLRRLLGHIGLHDSRVIVAGDTLNDHAMFAEGFEGIMVGNAEAPLREKLRGMKTIYAATAHGPEGVLEGLQRYGLIPDAPPAPAAEPRPQGTSSLVMIYHRLPYQEVRDENGELRRIRPKSPNGIIPTLLGAFKQGLEGSWVAWSLKDAAAGFEPRVPVDPQLLPGLVARRVPLSARDVHIFYELFSKEALWPIIFSFPSRARFNHAHWEHFHHVNRLFAEAAAADAAPGATVWIHDYNLWLVPGYLRALRPDLTIAFFHHTAFPGFDVLSILPWWNEIIGSLLQCDYVGFHIPRYIRNFVDAVQAHCETIIHETAPAAPRFRSYGFAVTADHYPTVITAEHRTLRLGAHPVGIHCGQIRDILSRPSAQERIRQLRESLGDDARFILSVERIDYVKGQLEKLAAFEWFLEHHPEWRGRATLVNICTPAAPGMTIYQSIQREIEQRVGAINGRFGTMAWTPIRFFFRSLPFEELVAYYAAADIAWITPLRDGLNLVAKEYVIGKHAHGGPGVLILSEFAGAAAELHGALLVNPYDVTAMGRALHRACAMPPGEQSQSIARMAQIIERHDIRHWSDEFLAAATAAA